MPASVVRVLDDQRRMVRELLFLVDRHRGGLGGDARSRDMVVDAPADVLRVRLPAVAPPSVLLLARVEAAMHVDKTHLVEHARHPFALLRQEARVLLVALPVLQIDLFMRDVPVAADDHFAALGVQLLQVRQEQRHEAELGLLALGTRRSRRAIHRNHTQIAEITTDIAALGVELRRAEADDHAVRFDLAVDAGAGVAFFSA